MRCTILKLSLFMTLIIDMLLLNFGTGINTKTSKAAENLAYRKSITVGRKAGRADELNSSCFFLNTCKFCYSEINS